MKKLILNSSFLAIVACLLWASAFTGVKIGLQYSPPLRFAGIRFMIAGVLLLPFALRSGNYFQLLKMHGGKILIISSLQIIVQYILFYKGLSLVSGALGAIIIGAGPLFIAVFAHFSIPEDRLNLRKAMITVLGLSGVILVSIGRHSDTGSQAIQFLGILYLLGVNVASGVVNIFIKKKTSALPPLLLSSSTMLFGGFVIFMISLPFEGMQFKIQTPIYYYALAWLSFLSAGAFSIWFYLLKRPGVKVSYLNFWKFLIPVAGAILAWTILPNEHPDIASVAGVFITGISLVLLNVSKRKEAS